MSLPADSVFRSIKFRGQEHKYFVHEIGVPRFSEIDAYDVVWNGHYVSYCEIARHALCRHNGFDMAQLAAQGFYLPVFNYDLQIRKPLRSSDPVSVAVRLIPSAVETNCEFFHLVMSGTQVHAFGTVKHTIINKQGEIVTNLPEDLRQTLSKIAG